MPSTQAGLFYDQVSTFIRTPLGTRAARLSSRRPGLYALFFQNGMEHGNQFYPAHDATPALPILEQSSPTFHASVLAMFNDLGVLFVRLDAPLDDYAAIRRGFISALQPLGDKVGPCQRIGLLTGAGLPLTPAAVRFRSLPSYRSAWKIFASASGRWSDTLPHAATFQGLLMTTESAVSARRYTGLEAHIDNNLVAHAPEITGIQSMLLINPPPRGLVRSGYLSSLIAVTEQVHRDFRLTVATMSSQSECGGVAKGARERPAPEYIHGGALLTLAEARSMTDEELDAFIVAHRPLYLQEALPRKPSDAQLQAAWDELVSFVAANVGRPIRTPLALSKAVAGRTCGPRAALIRALAGELPSTVLWKCCPGGPVEVAQRVWAHARRLQDLSIIESWVGNSGRKRRAAYQAETLPSKVRKGT